MSEMGITTPAETSSIRSVSHVRIHRYSRWHHDQALKLVTEAQS